MSASVSEGLPPAPTPQSSVLAVLQRIGRSLMLPIAVLPAAALLLRFGQPDLLVKWWSHFDVLATAGNALFANLPLLFAIGVAVGFARRSDGSTALAAVVGYLIFDRVTMAIFATTSLKEQVLSTADDFAKAAVAYPKPNPTGVIGGIVIGVTAALLYNRFYRVKLVSWLAFFGGRRFVPIITALAALVLGVAFGYIWTPIGNGLNNLGDVLTTHGAIGAGIYGAINRLLLPFGLHHIVNSLVWFVFGTFNGVHGDLNRYFAGDPTAGTFMAGFFPIMMFGLPAAALAIWRNARPSQRKVIGGIMLSGALTSLITGVTEPIEFSFLFIAPLLFGIHIVLTGVSMWLAAALGAHIGFGFSAGLTDFLLNYTKSNTTKPWLLLILGVGFGLVYYVVFDFLIKRLNILTPGREPEEAAAEEVTQPEPVPAEATPSPTAARASAAEPAVGPAEAAPRAEPGDRGAQPG